MSGSHSPLGFSGAERWANCPGSVALIASLPADAAEADPEYRQAGTAAHAAAATCLIDGIDAWEGPPEIEGYTLTAEDLRAIQTYLDVARERIAALKAEAKASVVVWIERQIHAPEIHELAYGTLDLALIAGDYAEVIDYKHGEGHLGRPDRQLAGHGLRRPAAVEVPSDPAVPPRHRAAPVRSLRRPALVRDQRRRSAGSGSTMISDPGDGRVSNRPSDEAEDSLVNPARGAASARPRKP